LCHQIQPDGLGTDASFTAGFQIDASTPLGQRVAYGPFDIDRGRQSIMRAASGLNPRQAGHIQQSAICGSCHTLYTNSLDAQGKVVGRLAEQTPYLEWRRSSYVDSDPCQSCHMPVEPEPAAVSNVLGIPREHFSRHSFRGGNFFMLGIFARHAAELSVTAPAAALEGTLKRTREHLQTQAARVEIRSAAIAGRELVAEVAIRNLAGHKLPTAYPSRRAWIRFRVRDADGQTLFESGALRPDGSIAGNANDVDAARYEPHYTRITEASQVQIYEGILADPEGAVTTGLLTAVRYIKDNRILPDGFAKAGAPADIAVKGDAATDAGFDAGVDVITFAVPLESVAAPVTVEAELWYQPIGFRWARNLEHLAAAEPRTFVRLYKANAADSAIRLAGAAIRLP
jgi:hypothetical protein